MTINRWCLPDILHICQICYSYRHPSMLSFARILLGAIFPFAGAAATNVSDYVIVGGGATGLSLAVRLSEDPNRTVVVLEAGNRYRSPLLT